MFYKESAGKAFLRSLASIHEYSVWVFLSRSDSYRLVSLTTFPRHLNKSCLSKAPCTWMLHSFIHLQERADEIMKKRIKKKKIQVSLRAIHVPRPFQSLREANLPAEVNGCLCARFLCGFSACAGVSGSFPAFPSSCTGHRASSCSCHHCVH